MGVGYGNPEIKDPSAKNPKWVQDAGRVDFVAGLTYSQEKLKSNLTFKYLGDREDYKARQIPARARLTWNTTYDFTKNDSVTVTFNNLLDRENYSNRYGNLDLPFNWRVMYTHTFLIFNLITEYKVASAALYSKYLIEDKLSYYLLYLY